MTEESTFVPIRKMSSFIPISHELLNPPELKPGHFEPPPAEELLAYEQWRTKFDVLRAEGMKNGWFNDGGPDYDFEYCPPADRWIEDGHDS